MRDRWRSCLETVRTNRWAIMLRRRTKSNRSQVAAALAACVIAGLALGVGSSLLRPPATTEGPVPAAAPGLTVVTPEPQPAAEAVASTWVRPVAGEIVGEFGWRWSPIYRDWRLHRGLDLVAVPGEAVVSIGPGTVTGLVLEANRMYRLTIDHPGLGEASYCNLGMVTAHPGQEVAGGEVVGTVGDCLPYLDQPGPHLRLELYVGGQWTDPRPVVDGAGRPAENR